MLEPSTQAAATCLRRFRAGAFAMIISITATACTANDTQNGHDTASAPPAKAQPSVTPVKPIVKSKEGLVVTKQNLPTGSIPSAPGNVSVPNDLIIQARDWVAREANVKPELAVLKRAMKATWNDGSLGCPEPGMAYTQALVEGYWLVFYVGQTEYDMRSATSGKFMRCQSASKRDPIQIDNT